MYMKLTWTTILIFDVHFDVQFNGTPQMRDAVFNFKPLDICIISYLVKPRIETAKQNSPSDYCIICNNH